MKAIDLTSDELSHVRAALKFLRARCGGWANVAKVLHVSETTVSDVASARKTVTPMLAFRVARFVKVGVDDLLAGKFPPAGTCPHCGHQAAPVAPTEPTTGPQRGSNSAPGGLRT